MISLDRLISAIGGVEESVVPRLEEQRDAARKFIETQTRRYFGPVVEHEEIVKGSGTRKLWLSDPPAATQDYEGLTVQEYLHPGAVPTDLTEGASDGFEVRISEDEAQLVRLGAAGVWTQGREYVIRYSRGYEIDHGPKDVEDLLIELVKLKQAGDAEEVMKSESIAGYTYTRFDDGDLDSIDGARDTIKSWRRLVFA